jgi:Uma2 family endonuclease
MQPGISTDAVPPLQSGDRLTRREFESRYETTPEKFKAELVEGVVYVAQPTSIYHARPHGFLMRWLGTYMAATPGLDLADTVTLRLDLDNEVQPDAVLRIDKSLGGQSAVSEEGYLEGPPELIVEVAATSAAYDLHDKLQAYRRNGVQEYAVWQVYEQKLDWFKLKEGQYVSLAADTEGVIHSRVFPGLCLNVKLLLEGDLAAVLARLQDGLGSPAHASFVERLRSRQ